jgi:hypothetical protein
MMTDSTSTSVRRGIRARWRVVAVVAPAAAALFAGSTSWALANDPTAKPATPPKAAPEDPQTAALRAAITADQKKLTDLQKRLDALTRKAAALAGSQATAGQQDTSALSGSSGQAAAPAPAPAPPAHTTTGASGAPR